MKVGTLFLALLLICGCRRPSQEIGSSESGQFVASVEISGPEAGPTRQYCVRLRVHDKVTGKEFAFQTGASDAQKWAVSWVGEALVLYSSDVGTFSYDPKDRGLIERDPTKLEQDEARRAYEVKYSISRKSGA